MIVKGKTLKELTPNTIYKGCTFYIDTIFGETVKDCIFENCSFRGEVLLNFESCNLEEMPGLVFKIPNLKQLFLAKNHIKKIPKQIALLKNLQNMDISRNNISEIPKEMGQLSSLQILYIYGNEINEIPKEISQIQKLRIDISHMF